MKRIFIWILAILVIAVLFITSCEKETTDSKPDDQVNQDSLVNIIIFYTNDEHGWFEAINDVDGGAGLSGLWKSNEGYDGSENFLILSGGDMWTGAAASTWFEGESMVEVMNAMEYDAAAIGNHEFDFKIEGLNQRISEMDFPLLAANLKEKSTGKIPDFAQPYIIKEISGIQVGIIGLSSRSTPYTTFPANVADYEFTSYADAIIEFAPKAINDGADVLVLISHLCKSELEELADVAKQNSISVMGGGHCHQVIAQNYNDIILLGGGSKMSGYAKVEFNYNVTKDTVQDFEFDAIYNNVHIIDEQVKTVVDYWMTQTNEALSDVIGYASEDITPGSVAMGNLVCDSWLYTFSDADVSITNAGGIRQDIFAGDITMGTMVGLLPFENTIVELELTGEQLIDCINGLLIGGMTTVNGYFLADGTPIGDQTVYKVLTTDYLYSQTSINFSVYDPDPYLTGVHYRQPLIDWLKYMNTNSSDPLNNYLDYTSRY